MTEARPSRIPTSGRRVPAGACCRRACGTWPAPALLVALARAGLQVGVGFLGAGIVFGRSCRTVGDGDEVEVRLAGALVDVREDVRSLDPALRLLEVHRLAIEAREMVGVVAEMAIVDGDFGHRPIVAALNREVLRRRRNGEQHHRRAKRGQGRFTHHSSCPHFAETGCSGRVGNGVARTSETPEDTASSRTGYYACYCLFPNRSPRIWRRAEERRKGRFPSHPGLAR